MTKILRFEVDNAEIAEENNENSHFATARLHVFSSGVNRHGMNCSEEVLQRTAHTIHEKPIIFELNDYKNDFGTHNDGVTVPAGFIVPNSGAIERLPDGRLGLIVFGKIWKKYSGKFLEIFKNRNKTSSGVSVEMELIESFEREDGIIEMVDFAYSAVCVLGDDITEASQGAEINMLSFSNELREDFIREFSTYSYMDFTIPESIKRTVKKGFELREKNGRGGTGVALSMAKFLLSSEKISPDKARQIKRFFDRHASDKLDKASENNEFIAHCMYGGIEGKKWAVSLVDAMEERDGKIMSFFAKDLGTGDALKIDKKKESMSNTDWGSVDKIALRDKVLKAKNYKSLVDDVYMVVEAGWEEAPSSNLKYPVMQLKGDTLVYNRGALASALGYAKKNNETGVVSKLEKIYKKMDLQDGDDGESKKEKRFMAKNEGTPEEEKTETPEEEKAENPETQKKEEMAAEPPVAQGKKDEKEKPAEAKMSLDAYLDVAAMLAMLEKETESFEELKAEFSKPMEEMSVGKIMAAMFAKMCKMSEAIAKKEEEGKAYMAKNEELEAFKANVEKERYEFEVQKTLDEVRNSLPKDEFEAVKEDAKNFSLETVDAYKNMVKAKAFGFAVGKAPKRTFVEIGLPFSGGKDTTTSTDLWK